jgi:N-acetylmuramoyl-L-alanine amidase
MPLIVLDPGHGQFGNKHTTADGFYEGTQNFKLVSMLSELLRQKGFEVVSTRKTVEDDPSLEERGRLAGELAADMFISIHSNAPGASNPNYSAVRGSETFYSVSDAEANAEIALMLNRAVVEAMGTVDRGIKTRRYPGAEHLDYYSVIRNAALSGCKRAFLIEHGFHTNPEDSAVLQSDEGLMRIAVAECEILCKIFDK